MSRLSSLSSLSLSSNHIRCRKLYEKYLEYDPANVAAWAQFAELEGSLGEGQRARALFELAISQPALDMPEVGRRARRRWWS